MKEVMLNWLNERVELEEEEMRPEREKHRIHFEK